MEKRWNLLSFAAAVGAGVLARKLMTSLWTRAADREPPQNPAAASTGWQEAVAWSAALGAAVGVARLLGRRGAAAVWTAATGELPYDDDFGDAAGDPVPDTD